MRQRKSVGPLPKRESSPIPPTPPGVPVKRAAVRQKSVNLPYGEEARGGEAVIIDASIFPVCPHLLVERLEHCLLRRGVPQQRLHKQVSANFFIGSWRTRENGLT